MRICPRCGEENSDRFRLCGFCGTALAPALPAQEIRTTVTIVFSDLLDSTSLGERIDSESLREVMTRYFAEMRGVLERHGGLIEKYIGDAIMAVFGLPRVHEDDALRAVRAAADMQHTLLRLNDELDAHWGLQLANRIGVNTGEVVVGDPGAGQRLAIGDAINVAARLEQAAPAMQVLIGEPTYRLVRHQVDAEALAPLTLKGKSRPVPAYRLLAVHGAAHAPVDARHTQIVGRALETSRLLQEFELAVSTRSPALVTILGEAGIGKSRLIEEFARALGPQPLVLAGRCLAYGRGITFWPLGEIVRQAAEIGEEDPPEVALAKLRGLLGDDADADGAADPVAAAIGLSPRQFPLEEVFWGIRKLLQELGRLRPLVVIFEDIHWAEATLLDLIERVAATAVDTPLLLVCATRPELAESRPGWLGRPEASVIELDALSGEQSALVVGNLLGEARLDERALAAIVSAADGNPLFAEQMLSMLIDDGYLRLEGGRWIRARDLTQLAVPPTIQALLSARLDLLAGEERAVLEPAAVVGGLFQMTAVRALVIEMLRAQVPDHLDSLQDKQLIEAERTAVPDGDTWFRFHHMLIRDAAYHRMLKRTRAVLHERFADWLDAVYGRRARGVEYEEIVGHHLEQAYQYLAELGPLDEHGRALGVRAAERLSSAGRRAFARADMSAAANLLRRAAALLPAGDPTRLGLLPSLGEALMGIGEFPWAILFLDEAVELSRDQPRLHADAIFTRLLVRRHVEENLERWREEVTREAERLIPMLQQQRADAELTKVWRTLGMAHGSVARYGQAAAAVQEAVKYARRAKDTRQEALVAFAYTQVALNGPTPVTEAIEHCERLAAEGLSDRQSEALLLCTLARLRAMRGDFEQARKLVRTARTLLDDLGIVVLAAWTAMHWARIELLAGDLETAERELRRATDTLTSLGEKYLLPPTAALLAQVLYAQGRSDEAEQTSRSAEEIAAADDVEAQTLWRSVRAKVLAGRNLFEEAEQLARDAVELIRTTEASGWTADALLDLAEVLRRSARFDEARAVATEAHGIYEEKGNLIAAARAMTVIDSLPARADHDP